MDLDALEARVECLEEEMAELRHGFNRDELRLLIATQALAHCYYQGIGVEQLRKRCFEVADSFLEIGE